MNEEHLQLVGALKEVVSSNLTSIFIFLTLLYIVQSVIDHALHMLFHRVFGSNLMRRLVDRLECLCATATKQCPPRMNMPAQQGNNSRVKVGVNSKKTN